MLLGTLPTRYLSESSAARSPRGLDHRLILFWIARGGGDARIAGIPPGVSLLWSDPPFFDQFFKIESIVMRNQISQCNFQSRPIAAQTVSNAVLDFIASSNRCSLAPNGGAVAAFAEWASSLRPPDTPPFGPVPTPAPGRSGLS